MKQSRDDIIPAKIKSKQLLTKLGVTGLARKKTARYKNINLSMYKARAVNILKLNGIIINKCTT